MVLTIAEQERMKLIRRLAVIGEAYVDEDGYMDIHFDLRGNTSSGSEEEAEDVKQGPNIAELVDSILEKRKSDADSDGKLPNKDDLMGKLNESKKLEEVDGEKYKTRGDVVELYEGLVEEEGEEAVDYGSLVDTKTRTGRRSIADLTPEEKEFLVDLYINDIPTKVIMASENVTKSALYSSLERERIPRKGKLNTIIRRLEDGDKPLEISSEEDTDISVINRIIKTLE